MRRLTKVTPSAGMVMASRIWGRLNITMKYQTNICTSRGVLRNAST